MFSAEAETSILLLIIFKLTPRRDYLENEKVTKM